MSNAVILVLISIIAIAGIVWLVIYSGRRGEEHREKTTIKTRDSVETASGAIFLSFRASEEEERGILQVHARPSFASEDLCKIG